MSKIPLTYVVPMITIATLIVIILTIVLIIFNATNNALNNSLMKVEISGYPIELSTVNGT